MKNKLIAAAAGLVGYGSLLGWAVTADRYEKKVKGLAARVDDLESLNDFLRKRPLGHITSMHETPDGLFVRGMLTEIDAAEATDLSEYEPGDIQKASQESETENPPEENSDEDDEEEPAEDPETTRANLQALIDQYTANADDVDTFVARTSKSIEAAEQTPPFVISQATYSWDEDEGDDYAKITVTYYPRNRVVLDDDQEPMDDVANILGWRNLAQFGGESGDPDVVFIRNRRMMTDFEVVREEESELPLHVKYGMGREEFEVNKAAGTLRLRDEDR